METIRCPLTGVPINPIILDRVRLDLDEATTVWVLWLQGTKYNHIAQHLGANPLRIGEVLRCEMHRNARSIAIELVSRDAGGHLPVKAARKLDRWDKLQAKRRGVPKQMPLFDE